MRIAIDVMGGDLAPRVPVLAAVHSAQERKDVSFVLIGREADIRATAPVLPANVEIRHTDAVIASDDEPVRAVRRKPDASLALAVQMVRDGTADVMMSAGNTGALVASSLLILGRLEGIDRPALAPVLPTFDGTGVLLLDAGATMDAHPHNLVQYAYMGVAYSKYVLGVPEPRVGLVNVGTESTKGNALTKETFPLFEQARFRFVGNVEARDVLDGGIDVAVCDGFVGNVMLKLVEGVGLGIFRELKQLFTANLAAKLAAGMVKSGLRGFRNRFDYAEYGGAPFLGVAGGCIKAHGSSNERAWVTAIARAVKFAEQDLLSKIRTDLAENQHNLQP
ncbi:MAG: phosphate acyltransferase PlsX [Alicyclobacillus sp.]|nr:phosphate acyltransferase PlsX [Alicyclobacillus sp.]